MIIGISGCSSSGKTTLARALRDVFNHAGAGAGAGVISCSNDKTGGDGTVEGNKNKEEKEKEDEMVVLVHEDDFYRDEEE